MNNGSSDRSGSRPTGIVGHATAPSAVAAGQNLGDARHPGQRHSVLAEAAGRALGEIQRRTAAVPELTCDADWAIMLDLVACTMKYKAVTVSDACIASLVAKTTALRRLSRLEELGAVLRVPDPADRRRVFLRPAPWLVSRMETWLLGSAPPGA